MIPKTIKHMMYKKLIFSVILIFSLCIQTNANSYNTDNSGDLSHKNKSITVEEIKSFYDDIFLVEAKMVTVQGRTFFSFSHEIQELEDSHILSELINDNEFFFLYMITNWTLITDKQEKTSYEDSLSFPKNYYDLLKQDSTFNDIFLPIVINYLETKDIKVENYSDFLEKQTMSIERILGTASRFFYPDGIGKNGGIRAYVCVGINGLKDLEEGRNAYIEALAYSAINQEMIEPKFNVRDSFVKNFNYMNSLDLSNDDDLKIQRAQGVMWAMMYKEDSLKNALIHEFEKVKSWIPFVLE